MKDWFIISGGDMPPAWQITSGQIAEFLQFLSETTDLSLRSIYNFRDTLNGWWKEKTGIVGYPPGDSSVVKSVLQSIGRAREEVGDVYSPAAIQMVKAAIGANTRRSYAAPVAKYVLWSSNLMTSSDAVHLTAAKACNFFAHLVTDGRMKFSSIRVYRSALSNWWMEAMLGSDRPNPLLDESVSRILKGAEKMLLPAKLERAAKTAAPFALTPEIIEHLRHILWSCTPHGLMRFAAITTGTYALLRPSELVGSAQHRHRALRAEQITFYADASSSKPVGLLAPGVPVGEFETPDHFAIAPLGITKADPMGKNGPVEVAGAPAVLALWEWMHLRRDMAPLDGDSLFQVPQSPPVSCAELIDQIETAVEVTDGIRPHITGKCFRKGGASGLLAGGAARPDIAAQGRWRNVAMVETYASARAKQTRALEVSRSMAPRGPLPGAPSGFHPSV